MVKYCKASAPASEHILVVAARAAFAGMLDVRCNVVTASLYNCKTAPGDRTDVTVIITASIRTLPAWACSMPCWSAPEMGPFLLERAEAKMHDLPLAVVSTRRMTGPQEKAV